MSESYETSWAFHTNYVVRSVPSQPIQTNADLLNVGVVSKLRI